MPKTIERDLAGEVEIVRQAFDQMHPHILDNPFFGGHWPTPQQTAFLSLHLREGDPDDIFEGLYGGAAGGGKSDALLMGAAQYAWKHPRFAGICFRRTLTELEEPGALLDRAKEWWLPHGAKFNGHTYIFRFPSGAKVSMAYLRGPQDHLRYRSSEYQYTAWDELTSWDTETQYLFVGRSRVRRPAGSEIPLRTLSASNPGGPGHGWVKNRFVEGDEPGEPPTLQGRFVPARIIDNPHIDQLAYMQTLEGLHPTVRDQLLRGDWRARDPGDYFRAEWFGPLLDPEVDTWPPANCVRIRWWDLAASAKPDASKTAGVRMARHHSGVRAIEHCRSGRWTPGTRDGIIVDTAKADGKTVIVGIEIEPGSGGIAQFLSLRRRLRAAGFKVVGARPQELAETERELIVRNATRLQAKAGRADPVAACLERGYFRRGEGPRTKANAHYWGVDVGKQETDGIRLFAGPWTMPYLDAVQGFPPETGKEGVDEVDATASAWAWTEAHPAGLVMPPTAAQDRPGGDDDDDEDWDEVQADRDPRGHWTA
jgi:phage terminase large subunit-like protein